jgi:hypothetical protein
MNVTTINKQIIENISLWENDLKNYSIEQLTQTVGEGWTLGQVYIHLIKATTGYHLAQIETCMASNENKYKFKNFKGFMVYNIINGFPPIKIAVPPSDAYTPMQPTSIQEIADGLNLAKNKVNEIKLRLETCTAKGKTKHPGLSYLNAKEWYRLIALHFTHHLRQKETICNALIGNK